MGLPSVPLPKGTVDVGGEAVEVRGLSRAEAMRLSSFSEDPDAGEAFVLARGADLSEAEAQEWREVTPVDIVGAVVDRILELSGLTEEGASKSDGEGSA